MGVPRKLFSSQAASSMPLSLNHECKVKPISYLCCVVFSALICWGAGWQRRKAGSFRVNVTEGERNQGVDGIGVCQGVFKKIHYLKKM